MVEDIITSFGDEEDRVEKSQEYSGFQRFLFTSLEALDIDVSDYIGTVIPLNICCLKHFLNQEV